MISGTSNRTLMRWGGLTAIALAELTCLAVRIEMPAAGFLSYLKGFPSIFMTSLAAVAVLGSISFRGKLGEIPIFQGASHRPWPMILAHWGAFAVFFWLTIFVSEGDALYSDFAFFWVAAWIVTGLGAGVFWMLAASPARAWIRLVRENSSLVWAGVIIIAASWVFGFFSGRAWEPLIGPTFRVVEWLLSALGQEVVAQPEELLLGTPRFAVEIYHACAGYEGIGLVSVFTASYLWLFRGSLRFPRAFILLPLGILVIWLVNAVRITLLILFGTYVSPEIALGGFHAATGWLGFIAVALGMVAATQKMPFFAVKPSGAETKVRESDPTAAYLAPLMALLAIIMVTRVFSSGFDWFYPLRVLGTGAAIWLCWRSRVSRSDFTGLRPAGAVGIGAAVYLVWAGLEQAMGGADGAMPAAVGEMPAGLAAGWLVFRVIGSVVTVPMAEELAFRGYLLRRLVSADFDRLAPRFTWGSFLVSSVLFGALHGRWLAGTVAGMFYAWAMYRRGRVGDAIVAHATTNTLIAADVLVLGHWNYWG